MNNMEEKELIIKLTQYATNKQKLGELIKQYIHARGKFDLQLHTAADAQNDIELFNNKYDALLKNINMLVATLPIYQKLDVIVDKYDGNISSFVDKNESLKIELNKLKLIYNEKLSAYAKIEQKDPTLQKPKTITQMVPRINSIADFINLIKEEINILNSAIDASQQYKNSSSY